MFSWCYPMQNKTSKKNYLFLNIIEKCLNSLSKFVSEISKGLETGNRKFYQFYFACRVVSSWSDSSASWFLESIRIFSNFDPSQFASSQWISNEARIPLDFPHPILAIRPHFILIPHQVIKTIFWSHRSPRKNFSEWNKLLINLSFDVLMFHWKSTSFNPFKWYKGNFTNENFFKC